MHAGENRVLFPVGKHVASLEIKTKEVQLTALELTTRNLKI